MHDMEGKEEEAKVEKENLTYPKNIPNIETKPKAQQQKAKKTSPSLIQKKTENWKDQVSDMMKDLRTFIMVDVQVLMNENMKEFMKELIVNIKNNIVDTMKTQTTINNLANLTPMSPLEPIIQDSPQSTPQS